jgi:anti-anti-sigma regulatory factor
MCVKRLNLLPILQEWCPECILQAQGKKSGVVTTIFRLGFDTQVDVGAFQDCLQQALGPQGKESAYVINLQSIDIISPSAARALLQASIELTKQRKVPVIFTGVRPDTLDGLQTMRRTQDSEQMLWAVDGEGKSQLVGILPDRLQDILRVLDECGPSSASDLVEYHGEEITKKTINRYSVYLQELFTTGLVVREKVIGSVRPENERGWTYKYRPAYEVLTSLPASER